MEYLHWKLRRAARNGWHWLHGGGVRFKTHLKKWSLVQKKANNQIKRERESFGFMGCFCPQCKDGRRCKRRGLPAKLLQTQKFKSNESQSEHLNFMIRIGSYWFPPFPNFSDRSFPSISSQGAGKALGNPPDGFSTCSACIVQAC